MGGGHTCSSVCLHFECVWLSLSVVCVCVCVCASCFCVHVGCGAGLYIKGRGSGRRLGCGASTYSPGHWEGWVPGTPVFYDPCVAGPQAPGRTGLGDSREADAPGPLPAEPGLPCPVTQRPEGTPGSRWSGPTFDGWGNRGPRAHTLWWPWQPLMPGMALAAPPQPPGFSFLFRAWGLGSQPCSSLTEAKAQSRRQGFVGGHSASRVQPGGRQQEQQGMMGRPGSGPRVPGAHPSSGGDSAAGRRLCPFPAAPGPDAAQWHSVFLSLVTALSSPHLSS